MDRKISLAIPHYNNSNFIIDAILPALNDDRVSEIIICDDYSKDVNILQELINNINNTKIKLFINNENKGCYHNKIETVSKCTNEWAILLDSDNILSPSYIDKLFEIPQWDETVIYSPSFAKTFPGVISEYLNFTKYENTTITRDIYINNIHDNNFKCLINDCNYFIPIKSFLCCMTPIQHNYDKKKISSLDAAIFFTDWLCYGNTIFVVKDLHYDHRVHPNSTYMISTHEYENEIRHQLLNKIFNMIKK